MRRSWAIFLATLCCSASQAEPGGTLAKATNSETWFTRDDYPSEPLRLRQQGATFFELWIDSAGHPYRCYTLRSSDVPVLDIASCALVLKRGIFEPALDTEGRPIASSTRRWARWLLPNSKKVSIERAWSDIVLNVAKLPAGVSEALVSVRFIRNVDGSVESCAVQTGSGIDQLDMQTCTLSRYIADGPVQKDAEDKPVRALQPRSVLFVLDDQTATRK